MHRENTEPDCVHPLKWISILALISMVSAQTVQVKPFVQSTETIRWFHWDLD